MSSWGEKQVKVAKSATEYGITQRSFFPTGSTKVKGKFMGSIDEQVQNEVQKKLKQYNITSDMRRYIRVMENETKAAVNQPITMQDGTIAYTDENGNISFVDGDAVNEIYSNELREEEMIDDMVQKCLLSDTVAHIILGKQYKILSAGESTKQLENAVHYKKEVFDAEASPTLLRCIDPKSKDYAYGIMKLRALIKLTRPVLEYKSNLANDDITVPDFSKAKINTGSAVDQIPAKPNNS
jgi:hypothetical protein